MLPRENWNLSLLKCLRIYLKPSIVKCISFIITATLNNELQPCPHVWTMEWTSKPNPTHATLECHPDTGPRSNSLSFCCCFFFYYENYHNLFKSLSTLSPSTSSYFMLAFGNIYSLLRWSKWTTLDFAVNNKLSYVVRAQRIRSSQTNSWHDPLINKLERHYESKMFCNKKILYIVGVKNLTIGTNYDLTVERQRSPQLYIPVNLRLDFRNCKFLWLDCSNLLLPGGVNNRGYRDCFWRNLWCMCCSYHCHHM